MMQGWIALLYKVLCNLTQCTRILELGTRVNQFIIEVGTSNVTHYLILVGSRSRYSILDTKVLVRQACSNLVGAFN